MNARTLAAILKRGGLHIAHRFTVTCRMDLTRSYLKNGKLWLKSKMETSR